VFTEGISKIGAADIEAVHELGYRIKLLGIAKPHGKNGKVERVEMRVHPTLVPLTEQIAQVSDSYNAVMISGDFIEHSVLIGRGAGERPTASAVVADIMDIARVFPHGVEFLAPPMGYQADVRKALPLMPMEEVESEYYLRLTVKDMPGVIASVATILAEHQISLEAMQQKERNAAENVAVVMLTHLTTEGNLQAAIRRIEALSTIAGEVLILRKEPFGD